MNINHTKMTLEINSCKNYEILEVRQGDKGSRIIDFAFTVNGETAELASTMSAKVNATVDDVIVADSVAAVVDTENNVVTVTLTDTMLALSGICKMDIVLTEGDEIITAETVCLRVGKSVINEDSKAFPGASSIVEITKEVENARGSSNSLGARLDTVDTNLVKKANKSDVDSINSRLQSAEQNLHSKANATDVANVLKSKEDNLNKVSSKTDITDSSANYPSIEYLNEYYYDANETDKLLGKLKSDLDEHKEYCHQYDINLFNKDAVITGHQVGTTTTNYTEYSTRNMSKEIEIPLTTDLVIYVNYPVHAIVFYDLNGDRLGGYTSDSFETVDNGYKISFTHQTAIKYIMLDWSNVINRANYADEDLLIVSTTPLTGEYVPYGGYPTLNGVRVAQYSDFEKIKYKEQTYSVFIGKESGKNNVESEENDDGRYNTALGVRAMSENTKGDHNTAVGYQALQKNTTGDYNTALGEDTLFNNSTGYSNVAVGIRPMQNNTTGSRNVAMGGSALYNNTTGGFNTVIGHNSGQTIVKENYNTLLGYNTDVATDVEGSIAIGRSTKATKSNQAVFGSDTIVETLLKGNLIIRGTDGIYRQIIFNDDGSCSWSNITT